MARRMWAAGLMGAAIVAVGGGCSAPESEAATQPPPSAASAEATQAALRQAMAASGGQGGAAQPWVAPASYATPVDAGQAPAAAAPAGERAHGDSYRIVAVGDVMMGSDWPTPIMDPRVTETAGPAELLGPDLSAVFQSGDLVFGNFEGTMHTTSANAKACANPAICFTFRSPPFHAQVLRRLGFTVMSNANNHSRDFGDAGRTLTYGNLTRAGIAVAGADTPGTRIATQTMMDGTRFAIVAFGHNPGLLQVTDYAREAAIIREAQAQADVVIVSCHIGAEGATRDRLTRAPEMFVGENRGDPYHFAHAAIDAGADIVLCHGPHVPRAVEVYRGRFIAYSLGNFFTYGRFNLDGISGLATVAQVDVDRTGALRSARILGARQSRPGGPVFDPANGAARQIGLESARDVPESGTTVAADGTVNWPH